MNAAWSLEQQRILVALGCTLYRHAARAAPATEVDGLATAVLRAAGQDPRASRDVDAWWSEHGLPPLAILRADPSAKRALWPRLRALRGSGA